MSTPDTVDSRPLTQQSTTTLLTRYLLLWQEYKRDKEILLILEPGTWAHERKETELATTVSILRYIAYTLTHRGYRSLLPDIHFHGAPMLRSNGYDY